MYSQKIEPKEASRIISRQPRTDKHPAIESLLSSDKPSQLTGASFSPVQLMEKRAAMTTLMKRPWNGVIYDPGKPEILRAFEAYLVMNKYGNEENPYENLDTHTLKEVCDKYLISQEPDFYGPIPLQETPSLHQEIEGWVSLLFSEVLTDMAAADFNEQTQQWREKTPQWFDVNGGPTHAINTYLLYRFCDYTQIEKMLPRIAWETFEDTVDSVKEVKRAVRISEPHYTDTWNSLQYRTLKEEGLTCLDESVSKDILIKRAFRHMGEATTRLSPFVSLSEDYQLLVDSTCPTMQSIVRSDDHLEDMPGVPGHSEEPQHIFRREEGIVRAPGYQRAPHIVMFEIPAHKIITPEMVDDAMHSREDGGVGLVGMREAKERLFVGVDAWKYAVAVAINPY